MLYTKASPSTPSSARLRIIGSIRSPRESWIRSNACELILWYHLFFFFFSPPLPPHIPLLASLMCSWSPSLFCWLLTCRFISLSLPFGYGSHRVSLLTDFEDASSYLDWTIGVHGIYITFPHPSLLIASESESSTPSPFSSSTALFSSSSSSSNAIKQAPSANYKKTLNATYLPEVMPAQGWDKIEAVDSAIHKAGWSGRITEEIRRSVKLRRYQSRACTVTWHQFVEWRKANGGKVH